MPRLSNSTRHGGIRRHPTPEGIGRQITGFRHLTSTQTCKRTAERSTSSSLPSVSSVDWVLAGPVDQSQGGDPSLTTASSSEDRKGSFLIVENGLCRHQEAVLGMKCTEGRRPPQRRRPEERRRRTAQTDEAASVGLLPAVVSSAEFDCVKILIVQDAERTLHGRGHPPCGSRALREVAMSILDSRPSISSCVSKPFASTRSATPCPVSRASWATRVAFS
jgi:hypothetical protein